MLPPSAAVAMDPPTAAQVQAPKKSQEFTIRGTLRDGKEPLAGVRITATSSDGFSAEAVTDKDGRWVIAVPKREPTRSCWMFRPCRRTSRWPAGNRIPGLSSLARPRTWASFSRSVKTLPRPSHHSDPSWPNASWPGLSFGLLLALTAVGLSLVFGTTGLTNFAHGEMVTFGAVAAFALSAWGFPLWAALIVAVLLGGALGWLQDWGLWKPLRRRGSALVPDDDCFHRPGAGHALHHPVLLRRNHRTIAGGPESAVEVRGNHRSRAIPWSPWWFHWW